MHRFARPLDPLLVASTLAIALGAPACGDSAVFGSSGSPTGIPSGSGGTSNPTSTTSGSTASGGSAAGTTTTSATQGGAGGAHQGGASAGGAGNTGGTGAGANPPVTVGCGATSCPAGPTAACCWDQYLAYGQPRGECVTGTPQNDGCTTSQTGDGWETRIECQLPSHCPNGTVCCGNWKQGWYNNQQYSYYEDLSCRASCTFPMLIVCDPAAPSTEGCPMIPTGGGGYVQSVCKASQLLPPGYAICALP